MGENGHCMVISILRLELICEHSACSSPSSEGTKGLERTATVLGRRWKKEKRNRVGLVGASERPVAGARDLGVWTLPLYGAMLNRRLRFYGGKWRWHLRIWRLLPAKHLLPALDGKAQPDFEHWLDSLIHAKWSPECADSLEQEENSRPHDDPEINFSITYLFI